MLALVTTILFIALSGLSAAPSRIPVTYDRSLTITVDGNLVEACINGVRVREGLTSSTNKVGTPDIIPLPPRGGVLGIKASNGNPKNVGFVASDSLGFLFTNSSWRCHVNAQPDNPDWCDPHFDDSHWPQAVEVALYGSDVRKKVAGDVFDPRSYWIWTSKTPANNGVIYCRVGIPADPNVVQPPEKACYTKKEAAAIAGAAAATSSRKLAITVDGNLIDVCINGISVAQRDTTGANRVAIPAFISLPPQGGELGIKANNGKPTPVGLVASDSLGLLVSNSSWRAHVNARGKPEFDYCNPNFTPTSWLQATEIAKYGSDSRGKIAGDVFNPSSYWIWTAFDPSNNGVVYFRVTIPADPNAKVIVVCDNENGGTGGGPQSDDSSADGFSEDGPDDSSYNDVDGHSRSSGIDDSSVEDVGNGSAQSSEADDSSGVGGSSEEDGSSGDADSSSAESDEDSAEEADGSGGDIYDLLPTETETEAPKIVAAVTEIIYRIVGEPVTIFVIFKGGDTQTPWTKNGVQYSSEPAIRIASVTTDDAGTYVTTVSNAIGSTTFTTILIVYVPPKLSNSVNQDYPVRHGDPIIFNNTDVIAGYPTPTVTWYKDGVKLADPPVLSSSASAADSGTYVVIAENIAGIDVHVAVVLVSPPPLVIGPSTPRTPDVVRYAGTTATLYCAVHGGDPCDRPTVSWTKDGAAFNGNKGGVVFFQSVSVGDAGRYECTFRDNGGRSATHSMTLRVIDIAIGTGPISESLNPKGGSNALLKCALESGSSKEQWYKNGSLESETSKQYSLSPVEFSDDATYVCLQNNSIGNEVKYYYVNVEAIKYLTYKTAFTDVAISNVKNGFIFQVKAVGIFRVALTLTQGVYQNNQLYVVNFGGNSNNDISIGKKITGKKLSIEQSQTVGDVLGSQEYRWFWISAPATGQVKVGSGAVVGLDEIISYTDTKPNAISPCCVGVAVVAGSGAVFVIYP